MKSTFFLYLLLIVNVANAKWVLYADLPTKNAQYFYADNYKKVDGKFAVAILKNYSDQQIIDFGSTQFKFHSKIESQVIDCSKNEYANVRVEFFKELNAHGQNYLVPYSSIKWHPTVEGSIQEVLYERICVAM